jgi:hypothetical protein
MFLAANDFHRGVLGIRVTLLRERFMSKIAWKSQIKAAIMAEPNSFKIRITEVINPSKFFFVNLEDSFNSELVEQLGEELQNYFQENEMNIVRPEMPETDVSSMMMKIKI